jgi:hypothetical protein
MRRPDMSAAVVAVFPAHTQPPHSSQVCIVGQGTDVRGSDPRPLSKSAWVIDPAPMGSAFGPCDVVPPSGLCLPALDVVTLRGDGEQPTWFNDQPVAGSLTMTSFVVGA